MKTDKEIIQLTYNKIHEFYNQLDQDIRTYLFNIIDIMTNQTDTREINYWIGFIHATLIALTDCTLEELNKSICK